MNDADRDDDPNFEDSESTAYNSVLTEENKEGQRQQDTMNIRPKQNQENSHMKSFGSLGSESKRESENEEKIWQ